MTKRLTANEKVRIYHNLLMDLHLARWTGNTVLFQILMDKIGAYSYARTNSNAGDTIRDDNERYKRTLLALDRIDWEKEYQVKKEKAEIERKEKFQKDLRSDTNTASAVLKFSCNREDKLAAIEYLETLSDDELVLHEMSKEGIKLAAERLGKKAQSAFEDKK